MPAPIRPVSSFVKQATQKLRNQELGNNAAINQVSGSNVRHQGTETPTQLADWFHTNEAQLVKDNPEEVHLLLATLRSKNGQLSNADQKLLRDLNHAQRLQHDIEQGSLAAKDQQEAKRLAHWCEAFRTPNAAHTQQLGHSFQPVRECAKQPRIQSSTNMRQSIHNRLAHLQIRRDSLTEQEQNDLRKLTDAKRLQKDIENGTLADKDVEKAIDLINLRKGFESPPRLDIDRRHSFPDSPSQSGSGFVSSNRPLPLVPPKLPIRPNASQSTHQVPTSPFRLVSRSAEKFPPLPPRNNPRTNAATHEVALASRALSVEQLFGRNLRNVTMQQGNNNTCYLLSAFDAMLHHPQGERLFRLIDVRRVHGGYQVKFPGHPEAVTVPESALHGKNVPTSNRVGIPILWNAYFKLPGARDIHSFDTTNEALRRMFGNRVFHAYETTGTTLAESNLLRQGNTATADIWTGTRLRWDDRGSRPINAGVHYHSIRPRSDHSMDLVNPHNTSQISENFDSQDELSLAFSPELTRIRL